MNKKIVGFGDLAGNYLNRLYVHEKYQGLGIATAITENLEDHAATQGIQVMEVHASITARPFFEYRGFNLVKEQQVLRNGVTLTNFVMKKNL